MVKKWRRKAIDDDDDLLDEDFDLDDDDDDDEGNYIAPRAHTRRYNPDVLSSLSDHEEIDEDELDEMLAKVRAGEYVPKKRDHWTLHVAYNALKSRNRPEI